MTRSQLPFEMALNDEAREILTEVASDMVLLFGVSIEEAVGRINRQWRRTGFTDELAVDVLSHDHTDSYWAKTIYFGPESRWWTKDETTLTPVPWP